MPDDFYCPNCGNDIEGDFDYLYSKATSEWYRCIHCGEKCSHLANNQEKYDESIRPKKITAGG